MPVPTDLSPHALLAASRHLAQVDGDWAGHIDRVGPCLLQAKPVARTLRGVDPGGHIAARMPDALLIEQLSALRGIGRWTVGMFLIYSLQRPDILPADDFGVREGYRRLKGLSSAPTARQIRVIGEA
jgi:3-methyladenine DNA glycosylase/8-oxoguanine DNA glycosylase